MMKAYSIKVLWALLSWIKYTCLLGEERVVYSKGKYYYILLSGELEELGERE
jgi:hypothetical protein